LGLVGSELCGWHIDEAWRDSAIRSPLLVVVQATDEGRFLGHRLQRVEAFGAVPLSIAVGRRSSVWILLSVGDPGGAGKADLEFGIRRAPLKSGLSVCSSI
jgi:hypothetical protein